MRKPGVGRDAAQLRDVGERVQVIRLAQPLLPHVDQPDALEPPGQRVDPAQADGDRRVLAHVRVDEQLPPGAMTRAASVSMPRSASGRQVLQHVERVALREGAVRERQPPQIAEQQVDLVPRLGGEERADVDPDGLRAPVAVPQQRRVRCRSRDRRRDRPGRARGTRAACRCGSSSRAAAATRARAARRRAAPRPGTSSAPRSSRAAADRGSPATVRRTAGRTTGRSAPTARRRACRGRPGSGRARAVPCEITRVASGHVGEQRLEPFRPARPRELRDILPRLRAPDAGPAPGRP